jgi:hypothetical protein
MADLSYGIGLSELGSTLQNIATVQDKQAMARAYQDELARQGAYRGQALQTFGSYLPGFTAESAQRQIGDAATKRKALYAGAAPFAGPLPYQQGRPTDAAYNQLLGGLRANYGGYGDWQFNQQQQLLEQSRAINQILNFARGTANVFPYRMYDASHAGDTMALIGGGLSAASGPATLLANGYGSRLPVGQSTGPANLSPLTVGSPMNYGPSFGAGLYTQPTFDPLTGSMFGYNLGR